MLKPKTLKLSNRKIAGFGMAEVLIAGAVTGAFAALSMVGLTQMLQIDQNTATDADNREQMLRAMTFMSNEARTAAHIEPNAQTFNYAANTPNFTKGGKTPVLVLQIPGVPQRVVYYIDANVSPWNGPKTIYRWGPPFDAEGNYPSDMTTTPNNPVSWNYSALIDEVNNSLTTVTCPTMVNGIAISQTDSVSSSSNGKGFYACVSSDGKSATIGLRRGETKDSSGSTIDLEVISQVMSGSCDSDSDPMNTLGADVLSRC